VNETGDESSLTLRHKNL